MTGNCIFAITLARGLGLQPRSLGGGGDSPVATPTSGTAHAGKRIMARMPFQNSIGHAFRDAHSVERATRRSRDQRSPSTKDRVKALKAARVAARRLLCRVDRLTHGKSSRRCSSEDSLDRRIRCGDPSADCDALNIAIVKLTRIRDRLAAIHRMGGRQC